MDVAVERPPPQPVKAEEIGVAAPPIVFESFASTLRKKDAITNKEEDEKLEATKAEMGEVREENERLKTLLSRVSRDYQSLQMHFLDVVKVKNQQATVKLPAPAAPAADDLVSLSLGTRLPNGGGQEIRLRSSSSSSGTETDHEDQLSLRLRSRDGDGDKQQASCPAPSSLAPVLSLSSDNSAENVTADQSRQLPSTTTKARKTSSGGAGDVADDETLQHQAKKARVSVRVKCDTPTMNDGCQWRKYGQKISKGNPCPRAYYRCTVAPSCPVRKQVQRCSDDMSILITTYEGTHNHPLPPAAAAMASTTSSAASMLLAGSSSSSSHGQYHHFPFATSSSSAAGLLLGPTTISTAASCPTVTLDLTSPHSSLLQHQSAYAAATAGYDQSKSAWSGGGYLGTYAGGYYGKPNTGLYGMAGIMAPTMSTRPEQQMYTGGAQSYLQRSSSGGVHSSAPVVTDTIAKAITSDPSFQSVLAAAITSYMGRGAGSAANK